MGPIGYRRRAAWSLTLQREFQTTGFDLGRHRQEVHVCIGEDDRRVSRHHGLDEPFYVAFDVNGYELALDPSGYAESGQGPVTYWGVDDVDHAVAVLREAGATEHAAVTDYGGGIRTAVMISPAGSLVGVIENPHFPAPLA